MGGTEKNKKEKKDKSEEAGKSMTPLPQTFEDNEIDDGDIATPKRGIDGDDDQPL